MFNKLFEKKLSKLLNNFNFQEKKKVDGCVCVCARGVVSG